MYFAFSFHWDAFDSTLHIPRYRYVNSSYFFVELGDRLGLSRKVYADCIKVVVPLNILAPASPMVVWLRMAPKYPGLGVQKQVVGRPI